MEGKKGTLTFGSDNTTARVRVVKKQTYGSMPPDYWLEYLEGETNKQLVHPDYGKSSHIVSEILLPEFIFNRYFKAD